MKYTLQDFARDYPDNDACLHKLFLLRHGSEETCSHCGIQCSYKRVANRKAYRCTHCNHQVYPMKGTIFEKSTTPLHSWFSVMFLMTCSRNGVSSKEVQRILGVTYKTAWRMTKKIREMMSRDEDDMLFDERVCVDESYVGGKNKNRHKDKKVKNSRGRSYKDKTPVFGIVGEETGRVIAKVVPNVVADTLQPILFEKVAESAILTTDEWKAYNGLDGYFDHRIIEHGKGQYSNNGDTTNRIEGFWTQLKRSIYGTHVQVSRRHLQNYVDEAVFRYNNGKRDTPMFNLTVNLLSTYPIKTCDARE